MVKNPPSNAGDMGLIPGQGTKIPHATGQLSPRATTTELACLNERAHLPQSTEPTHHNYRAHAPQLERENPHATSREKPVHHNKEPALRRKIPRAIAMTQRSQKKRKKEKEK